mmetsp:Transcript_24865/g.63402  ORF Transcript_24865/g.63402 Transcript_24865/m.63402 type:complete len:389 (-) Transcript_24865:363-1529(-)
MARRISFLLASVLSAVAAIGGGSSVPTSFKPPAGSPVAQHGRIRVQGSQLVDEHGVPVRLRGMSMFWSQWGGKYWNDDVVQWLVRDWKISLLRAPMGVEDGGYLEGPESERQTVTVVVDAAIRAGIYVIIDWHDHRAEKHEGDARKFFDKMAKLYGRFPNVFFEIFNEPLQESWETDIMPYEQQIVDTIRRHSGNLIICGTRTWSQDVDLAADKPLKGFNLAYTLHFYAAYHKESLREKARVALSKGIALVASEWGTCYFDGNGQLDLNETNIWLDFLAEHNISDTNWALNDKDEACSALLPGTQNKANWSTDVLTDSGRFVRSDLKSTREAETKKAAEEEGAETKKAAEEEGDAEPLDQISSAQGVHSLFTLVLSLLAVGMTANLRA